MFRDGKIPSRRGKQGCAQIPHTIAIMTTSNDHKIFVRTLIRAFLDSTESLLSLEFNKISAQPNLGLNIGLGHGQLRNGPFWFRNFCFQNRFVSNMLGAAYGLSRELLVECFVWY